MISYQARKNEIKELKEELNTKGSARTENEELAKYFDKQERYIVTQIGSTYIIEEKEEEMYLYY